MSAATRILDNIRRTRRPMRLLGASGQLGYGVPTPAFNAGLARKPDLIGADMGSIDIGPSYLGRGEMATAPAATRRDLRKLLRGARSLDIPLIIGSAGSAGAAPHLEATLSLIRAIGRAEGLSFRLGILRADIDRNLLKQALREARISALDGMPPLAEDEIDAAVSPRSRRRYRRADRRSLLRYRNLRCTPDDAGFPFRPRHAYGEDHRVRLTLLHPRRAGCDSGDARR
jgi:hypothetical protein